jgi:SAM-dependent methyltransferase
MVHALEEVTRVLAPGGILIDMRPLADHWRVEVASLREVKRTGHVTDLPEQTKGDVASSEAMSEVERRGWFQREQEELYPYFYSWDTPSEMEEFIADDWKDFIGLDEDTRRATRSAWALADGDSRVRIRVEVLIARWRKADWQSAPPAQQ